jgi:hypothetical protein
MNFIKLSTMFFLVCAVAGCTKVKSVEYYEQHVEEAKRLNMNVLRSKTKGKSWEGDFKENCQNAAKVANKNLMNDFIKKTNVRVFNLLDEFWG